MPKSLFHPRHWPSWMAVALLRLIALLPFRSKIWAGTLLGKLAYKVFKRRRHITQTNIRLCFPELSEAQQEQRVKEVLIANGIGLFEIAWAWWAVPDSLKGRFDIEGLEVLKRANADGQGVLLIGGHYTHLDLCGLMVNLVADMDVIYRRNNNPVFEYVITQGRQKVFKHVLERRDMRTIVRKLREGRVVWYSPDQDHGLQHSVFAPFFGVQAATVTATAKLMKMGQAKPVFVSHRRDNRTQRYTVRFSIPDVPFPTGDDVNDATIINRMLEQEIRRQPDQYMWVHRRFKTRPPGEPGFY